MYVPISPYRQDGANESCPLINIRVGRRIRSCSQRFVESNHSAKPRFESADVQAKRHERQRRETIAFELDLLEGTRVAECARMVVIIPEVLVPEFVGGNRLQFNCCQQVQSWTGDQQNRASV